MSAEVLRRAAAAMRRDADPRWHAVADWLVGEGLAPSAWNIAAVAVAHAYLGGAQ